MMKRPSYIMGALACALSIGLWSASAAAQATPPRAMEPGASDQQATKASKATQDYVEKSAIGDMFEVQSSELALEQAESTDVKAFAQRMIKDHTTSTSALKAGIQSAKIEVKVPDKLDKEHEGKLSNLRKAKGKEFDQAYMREQLSAHKEALELHKNYAEKGDHPVLKNTAANTATIVEHHLEAAQQLVKGTPQTSESPKTR